MKLKKVKVKLARKFINFTEGFNTADYFIFPAACIRHGGFTRRRYICMAGLRFHRNDCLPRLHYDRGRLGIYNRSKQMEKLSPGFWHCNDSRRFPGSTVHGLFYFCLSIVFQRGHFSGNVDSAHFGRCSFLDVNSRRVGCDLGFPESAHSGDF